MPPPPRSQRSSVRRPLYVLSRCVPVPPHELRELRKLSDVGFDVIATSRSPRRAAPRGLAVLDLTRCPDRPLPGTLDGLRGVELFLLVRQDQVIPVQWVSTVQSRRVTVIVEEPSGPAVHVLFIREVRARFRRRHTAVARVVGARLREAGLGNLVPLAHVLLRDMGMIRYPRQLAHAAGIREKRLRDLCREAGLERSSHFLMLVRCLVYEILIGVEIGVERMPQREALAFVRIRDTTNLKRQTAPVKEWLRRCRAG